MFKLFSLTVGLKPRIPSRNINRDDELWNSQILSLKNGSDTNLTAYKLKNPDNNSFYSLFLKKPQNKSPPTCLFMFVTIQKCIIFYRVWSCLDEKFVAQIECRLRLKEKL